MLAKRRETPERAGPAFDQILATLKLPEEIAAIPGGAYMVEEAATGSQCTIEGYNWQGEVNLTGIVDSLHYENSSSFLRYRYPSELPEHVQDRIRSVTHRVMTSLGLRNSTFNVEYFWDADTDRLVLLEVNTSNPNPMRRCFDMSTA